MIDTLMSVLFGGATGILGTIISKGLSIWEAAEKRKELKIKNEHELALYDKQMESKISMAELDLRSNSYDHDNQTGQGSQWVVNTLRMVRPSLTLFLLILLAIVYFTTQDIAFEASVVDAIVYASVSATLWWFGDRMTRTKK